jgi:predicted ATPase/DNA-binding SARP family transcriptional activator
MARELEPASVPSVSIGTHPALCFRLFGPVEIRCHGALLPRLRSRKEPLLLALLALNAGREVDRHWLAGTLWPEGTEPAALANLRNSLKDLRRALGGAADLLRTPKPRVLLLSPDDVDSDVAALDALLLRGDPEALEEATALYRGPLLDGYNDAWVLQERERREQAFLAALESLAERALRAGDAATAERHLRRVVSVDPLRESAQRALMRALATGGNHAAAFQAYRELRLLLHREINAQPDPESEALFRQLQTEVTHRRAPAGPAPTGALASSAGAAPQEPAARHNLPHPVTSFVGRVTEMAELQRLLDTTRLLTVTGAGGCGKSRLALEAAHDLLPETADGVWLVELASLAGPALVPQRVATVMGVREQPGEALTRTLIHALQSQRLLLLLDNCEHLLDACASLVEALLRDCPGVQIVATSRESLNIPGERLYRIPPLTFPEADRPPAARHELGQFEAVHLFVERASAVSPGFDLSDQNAASVARICRQLDGIPLAIELAAARVKALSVEALAERLDDRFSMLTGGSRTALSRHRTLRACIDWSYAPLSEPERALLRRLSVFAGGWSLEAAEAVGADDETAGTATAVPAVHSHDVLDLLTKLVDKSLVVYENGGGDVRYRLLETIRQFAQECLAESDEEEAIRRRHAEYYLGLAMEAEPRLWTPDSGAWLDRLEREQDNVRAVLGWVVARAAFPTGDEAVEIGLRLGRALHLYWETRSVREGREWLERLLTSSAGTARGAVPKRTDVRARAVFTVGTLAWMQGDMNAAKRSHQECLSIGRELEDRWLIAIALQGLGVVACCEGEYQEARTLFEESLSLRRELGDRRRIAIACNNLGFVTRELGDYDRAQALLEESLALSREFGNDLQAAKPLIVLGTVQMMRGDYPGALGYLHESMAITQELGVPRELAIALCCLGMVARLEGDLETSRARYVESTRLHQRLGNRFELVPCLVGLACTSVAIGEQAVRTDEETESPRARAWWARGTRLFGTAEALCETNRWTLFATDQIDRERWVAAARAGLGEAAFAAAWAQGRALSLDQAVAQALEGG